MTGNVRLKQMIVANGVKQCWIASKARVSEEKLSRAIHGHRELTADEQTRVARILGVSPEKLFGMARRD